MFLRQCIRKKDGKEHRYWSIVENKRLNDGRVIQRHVLYLGEINSSQEQAWRKSIEVFAEGCEQPHTIALFPEDRCEGLLPDESVVRLRLSELRLQRPRQWGACWLVLKLWQELQLDQFWAERLPTSRKGTCWDRVLLVLVAYRLIAPGSEWRLHRQWFGQTALADLLGADFALAEPHKLYACHDRLLEHKQALFDHLTRRWRDRFNASFEVLLYDLTSTYFEADPPSDKADLRRYGYSRDHRPDCVQVVIALVVTPEGFPLAYEVLAGNTADNTTLRAFLDQIETQYGRARRIWLMDRGIPTEAVLEQMRASDPPTVSGGHTQGPLEPAGAGTARTTLAERTPRGRGQAPAAGRRSVRAGAKCRARGQGTRHAPPATEVAMGAARTTGGDAAHARSAAHETGGSPAQSTCGLAPGNG